MRRFVTLSLSGLLSLCLAAEAGACLRKTKHRPKPRQADPTLAAVQKAEKLLAKGDHGGAVKHARVALAELQALPPTGAADLPVRAQRAAAIAAVRSGGKVDLGAGLPGKTEQDQRTNVAWAQLVLTYQSALSPDNLVLSTQLAEALAADPYQRARAREILSDLASRDVMPTARGYTVLAKLEGDRGDATARDAAIHRCVEFAGADACRA
jgi:hypothetical protein